MTRHLLFGLLLTIGAAHTASGQDTDENKGFSVGLTPSLFLSREELTCREISSAETIFCGDGFCDEGAGEDCGSCPEDCGGCPPPPPPPEWCGDGICNNGEDCGSCSGDCGACPPPPPVCGDGSCNGDETCSTCSLDCGACPPVCGDGACNETEDCSSCSADCGTCPPVCGDGVCTPSLEDCGLCPGDCPCWDPDFPVCQNQQCVPSACGDAACTGVESCSSCEADCGVCPPAPCGDGTCAANEDCATCQTDCGACPTPGEPNIQAYIDEDYDGVTFSTSVSVEADPQPDMRLDVEVSVVDDETGQVLATGIASGGNAVGLGTSSSYAADQEFDVEAFGGGGPPWVQIIVRVTPFVKGVAKAIRSWFKKVKPGSSFICYVSFPQPEGSSFCFYNRMVPCRANCASNAAEFYTIPKPLGGCSSFQIQTWAWVGKDGGPATGCKPLNEPRNIPACACKSFR